MPCPCGCMLWSPGRLARSRPYFLEGVRIKLDAAVAAATAPAGDSADAPAEADHADDVDELPAIQPCREHAIRPNYQGYFLAAFKSSSRLRSAHRECVVIP
jgi:hypothetical protein